VRVSAQAMLVQSTYPGPQPYPQGIPQVEDFGYDWVMWFANPP